MNTARYPRWRTALYVAGIVLIVLAICGGIAHLVSPGRFPPAPSQPLPSVFWPSPDSTAS